MKTRHQIEELTNHPDIQAAAELLRAAKTLMDELAAERHDSVVKFVAYELAATQWAQASNKFEALLREALA